MSQLLFNQKTKRVVPWNLVGYVFCAWLVGMILLMLAQVFIGTNGLNVYPSGEDFTWMRFVQPSKHYSLQRSWWALASRNPLAPWWYWVISPIILKYPEGLYIARKVIDLFLGVTTLLLVYELLGRRRTWIAVWTAILVLCWNFSSYLEQVLFVMLISIGFSLLSIYYYAVYLHTDRVRNGYLVASLVTFFIALGTYTIQCGVPLAVVAIGLVDAMQRPTAASRKAAFKNTITDTLGYAFLFVLFIQIWVTTSGPTSEYFKLDLSLFATNFLLSIRYFFWHYDVIALYHSMLTHWQIWAIVSTAGVLALLFALLTVFRKTKIEYADNGKREVFVLLLPLLVLAAISVPTLLLESTSDIWVPGARSEMLQQIFNPIAYLFIILVFIQLLRPYLKENLSKMLAAMCMVLLGTGVAMLSLEYNRKLYEQTNFERGLISGLKTLLPEITTPTTVIVKVKGYDWYDGHNPVITNLFMQYSYNTPHVRMETIGDTSSITSADPIVFGAKEKGVYMPGTKNWVPYKNIIVIEADKNGIVPIKNFTPAQFPQDTVKFSASKKVI